MALRRRKTEVVTNAIELRGLTKQWGDQFGLRDLDLDVAAGSVTGLIGPNGSGKTTTMRILLDHIRATAGTASVLGHDSRTEGPQLRAQVGYLPGELPLEGRWTAAQQLAWLASLHGHDSRHVPELAERLDLALDRPVGDLSKGNRQKVGIVSALLHDPDVLILDEPASGLDPLVRRELWGLLREAAERGCTVFLSSHVLGEVEEICDRVAILDEGRLVAEDNVHSFVDRRGRLVRIDFAAPVDRSSFERLPMVHDVVVSGATIELRVSGPIDALVKAVAQHEVVDLTSRPLSLEEMFLETVDHRPAHDA